MKGIMSGLQNLLSFFANIWDMLKMLFQFVQNMIKSLVSLLDLLITTVGNVVTIIATLPPWLIAFATATLGVSVLYIILGRETGK